MGCVCVCVSYLIYVTEEACGSVCVCAHTNLCVLCFTLSRHAALSTLSARLDRCRYTSKAAVTAVCVCVFEL